LSRGEYEKKDSKDYGDKEKKRRKVVGKIPLRGKKDFAMAPLGSLFECARLVARVASSQMRGLQNFRYHFSRNSRMTSSGERFR
jgi:hypothetical protein